MLVQSKRTKTNNKSICMVVLVLHSCLTYNTTYNRIFRNTVLKTFPHLADRLIHILYPSINTHFFDQLEMNSYFDETNVYGSINETDFVLLSINRFELKKNLELAILALGTNQKQVLASVMAVESIN